MCKSESSPTLTTPRAQIRLPVDEPLKKPVDIPFKTGADALVMLAFIIPTVGILIFLLALAYLRV